VTDVAATKDFRLNRVFSVPLTRLLLNLPVTPNQVTVASLACGVAAGALFSQGRYGASLAGALLYQLACVLDNCDGEIARAKGLGSVFGAWFDIVADFITDVCLFGGLALGVLRHSPDSNALFFGGLCLLGAAAHFTLVLVEKIKGFGPAVFGTPNPGRHGPLWVFFDCLREGDASLLVLLFALAGKSHTLVWLGALYMQALWIGALLANFRYFGKRA